MIRPAVLASALLSLVASSPALADSATAAWPQTAPAIPYSAPAPVFQSNRIIVEARGSGPDIIFIPGLGSTGDAWRTTADRLAGRYRVHLVTLRGFGQTDIGGNVSGGLSGPAAAEIERYIREQRIQRPALIGHSLGGQIAMRIAAEMGMAILSLIHIYAADELTDV